VTIDAGTLLPWAAVATAAAFAARVWAGRRHRPYAARAATLVLGAALMSLALLAGALLIRTDAPNPEDPRAIGVLVWRPGQEPGRSSSANLAVSAAVEMSSCDERPEIRLTITPTVEFWSARARALAGGAVVGIAVPDATITDLSASVTTDPLGGLARPGVTVTDSVPVPLTSVEHRSAGDVTVATVTLDRWGDTNYPVSFRFRADWIVDTTPLGRCYVELPSLVGVPTVLSAAEVAGRARDVGDELPGLQNDVDISSHGRHAGYEPRYQLTRGVTSVQLHGMSLDDGSSLPGPDANLEGRQAWTCTSKVLDSVGFIDALRPGDAPPDLAIARDANTGVYSLSTGRIGEVLGEPSCNTLAAVEESSLGTRRDFALIGIGALFSLGIERLVAAFHSVPHPPKPTNTLTSSPRVRLRRPRRRP
jgi:hypothetical protein